MSEQPDVQHETEAAEPTPSVSAPKSSGGAVKNVVMPVAEAAIGGVVTAAVSAIAQRSKKA